MTPSPPPPHSRDRDRQGAQRANRAVLWLSRHWLRVALTALGIFVTLPFVAPTLMRLGLRAPARVIYIAYAPFCHQFAFRSFFLWGEQAVYPRAETGTALGTFEDYILRTQPPQFANVRDLYATRTSQDWADVQIAAHLFPGNDVMGYKTTICQRDIAIYMALFLGGLLYSVPFVRRRLRPVPLLLWAILGLGPIGIDGFSQLLGYPPFELWPVRETLPFFRLLTGALFGLMNAWLGFPYLDESFREVRAALEAKFARAGLAA